MNAGYVVRLWDGWDGIWMDVSETFSTREEADRCCGDKNASRVGRHWGKREGDFDDGDYYAVFEADTMMRFSGDNSQTRGRL